MNLHAQVNPLNKNHDVLLPLEHQMACFKALFSSVGACPVPPGEQTERVLWAALGLPEESDMGVGAGAAAWLFHGAAHCRDPRQQEACAILFSLGSSLCSESERASLPLSLR